MNNIYYFIIKQELLLKKYYLKNCIGIVPEKA